MTDIDQVLREELPALPYSASDPPPARRFPATSTAEHLKATQFPPGVSGNPLGGAVTQGKSTLTRALREAMTIKQAETLAATAIEQAGNGNLRALEFIRDSIEGKPGVRIADGEWNPEQAPTFNVMMAYRERFMADTQTPSASALPEPADAEG